MIELVLNGVTSGVLSNRIDGLFLVDPFLRGRTGVHQGPGLVVLASFNRSLQFCHSMAELQCMGKGRVSR